MKFISPVEIYLPRKTKEDRRVALNLNVYRNLHHHISNQAKQQYHKEMKEQLEGVKFEVPISISLRYYKGTKRRSDKANVLCIVEKFFCDAMVEYGCIPDDNDNYIIDTHYLSTVYDKNKARVEIKVLSKAPKK